MNRLEAHAEYRSLLDGLSLPKKRLAMRELAKVDLFFLLVNVLRREDVDRDWLYDRCNEVQAEPDGMLDLWAREHYKSTIITFGKTIQDILCDPEITVGIFSHSRGIAKKFLLQIKQEFESNRLLLDLFPDILYAHPKREAPKWSEDDGIVVRREGNPRESTVEAWGMVDSQPTSAHFALLTYDDAVTRESVGTPDQIRKTTEAWELSLNLGQEGGRRRYIGTRYHFADSYSEMLRRKAATPRIHPATHDGTVNGEPVLMDREGLAEKRTAMGPYTFGCQMLLDPKADQAQGFKEEWLGYWPARQTRGLNLYILVDPASGKPGRDPDYTSMFVLGLGEDLIVRVIDMVRDRLNPTGRADTLFALHRQHHTAVQPVQAVGYEDYGMQADIHHMKERMVRENYKFKITPLKGRLGKHDRIRKLIPLFEQQRILLPEVCWKVNQEGVTENLTQIFIDEEYLAFPVGAHDDMIDNLARIEDPDFHMKPPGGKRRGHSRAPRADIGYDPHRR